ncbi:hypothetical protein D917_09527, partial [Trichinella nativa]
AKQRKSSKQVAEGNVEMFQPLSGLKSSEGYEKTTSLNSTHLENLLVKLEDYFPSLSIEEYDWVRDPYS